MFFVTQLQRGLGWSQSKLSCEVPVSVGLQGRCSPSPFPDWGAARMREGSVKSSIFICIFFGGGQSLGMACGSFSRGGRGAIGDVGPRAGGQHVSLSIAPQSGELQAQRSEHERQRA